MWRSVSQVHSYKQMEKINRNCDCKAQHGAVKVESKHTKRKIIK